jgi:DNA invertase Pin-like site-specific DNA recombinase
MNKIKRKSKVIAYLRISTEQQDLNSQKLELHEYAHNSPYA